MNKCYLQRWEESERGWGTRPDGCSLHLTKDHMLEYIDGIYSSRENDTEVPDEYDRTCGEPMECFVDDELFEKIDDNLVLLESEMNNLIASQNIFFKS